MSNRYNLRKRNTTNLSSFLKDKKERVVSKYKKRRIIVDSDSDVDIDIESDSDKSYNEICNDNESESESENEDESISEDENEYESESEDENDFINDYNDDDFIDDDDTNKEYFKLNTTPLKIALTRRIKKLVPNMSPDRLEESINTVLKEASDDILYDYCSARPNDQKWKLFVKENEIEDLESQLTKIREEIENNIPTMEKILKARIPSKDKKRAVQLFDNLQNMEPYLEGYDQQVEKINAILRMEYELRDHNIEELEKHEEEIVNMIGNADAELKSKILSLDADIEVKAKIYGLYQELNTKNCQDSEYDEIRKKLDWAINLPYKKKCMPESRFHDASDTDICNYLCEVRNKLDEELYGMNNVKERLIEILNDRIRNPKAGKAILLYGPPGIGKTAVVSAFARALGVPFDRVPMGGLSDSSLIKGSNNSWVGSTPSIFLRILKKIKVSDGIVQLDEIDKIESKEVQFSLLEPIDPIQNSANKDNFLLEFDHDLSNIWWFGTANNISKIDPTLKDRWELLELEKYSRNDKIEIITKYTVPKQLKKLNLNKDDIIMTKEACNVILDKFNNQIEEQGLRPIETEIGKLLSKINLYNTKFKSSESDKLRTSYTITDFCGYPYVITANTYSSICDTKNTNNSNWKSMYG